jgi:simple sugar transport system permease protein
MTELTSELPTSITAGAGTAGEPTEKPATVSTWQQRLSKIPTTKYGMLLVIGWVASIVLFALVAAFKGADPFSVLHTMVQTFTNIDSLQQFLLRAIPISLAALAVAIPARAGLVNVGGEGQLIMGMVAATGIGLAIGEHVPGVVSWAAMSVGGIVIGAAWGALAGLLRTLLGASEAVTTLLLNFVAADILLYLIYQPWRESATGQPQTRPLDSHAVLAKIPGTSLNVGVLVAAAATFLAWFLLQKTSWGFALRVVGGNGEAARRSGLKVRGLLLSSMLVGGAFAGLGGALHFAGVETQLRAGTTASFGYIAFLASFLGRGNPIKAVIAAVVFSAISLSSNDLQLINGGLDGTIVNVLLALVVAVPLVIAVHRKKS